MNDYKPNIAEGSVYSMSVEKLSPAKITIEQDNGQVIVVHSDDIDALIEKLKSLRDE